MTRKTKNTQPAVEATTETPSVNFTEGQENTEQSIPTAATESTESTQQPEVTKPKFNANAARKHRVTGSTIRLEKGEGGWVAQCETHSFASPAVKTRNDAEVLRVKGDFCPECAKLLSAKQAEQTEKVEEAAE